METERLVDIAAELQQRGEAIPREVMEALGRTSFTALLCGSSDVYQEDGCLVLFPSHFVPMQPEYTDAFTNQLVQKCILPPLVPFSCRSSAFKSLYRRK